MVAAGVPGARNLLKKVQNGASGSTFQAQRSYSYFKQDLLDSIEHPVGTKSWNGKRPTVDLRLKDGTRVEVKSWPGWDFSHPKAQQAQLLHLQEQVKTYLGGRGRKMVVEFDGTVPAEADQLLQRLRGQLAPGRTLEWGAV
jgi:hypothetical protein